MQNEITSFKENQTWNLEKLPRGRKAIPCKWIFKIKRNPDGSINKYKARLVAKGFNQKVGIDFSETFSPVSRLSTVRSVLSVAARDKLYLLQFDVSTAFLYGDLEEDIYSALHKFGPGSRITQFEQLSIKLLLIFDPNIIYIIHKIVFN